MDADADTPQPRPSLNAPGERVVEWYRPDIGRRLRNRLLPLSLPMVLGVIVTAWGYGRLDVADPLDRYAGGQVVASAATEAGPASARVQHPALRPLPEARRQRALDRRAVLAQQRFDGGPSPSSGSGWWMLFAGLGLVALGPFLALHFVIGLLREEHFLLLRTDGFVHERDHERTLVLWEDVIDVGHDLERGVVWVAQRSREDFLIRERFSGITRKQLARRVAEVRRKALFGLL